MSTNQVKGKFIVVGPKGCGKSSTADTLLADFDGHPFFKVADSFEDGTFRIKFIELNSDGNEIVVGDCLGFGDTSADCSKFGNIPLYNNFCEASVRAKLIGKKFKFLFCIKFTGPNPDSHFVDAAEQFCQVFGSEGVQSMVLIVIQTVNSDCLEDAAKNLYKTNGYKRLKDKNRDGKFDIPFVLWDNKSNRHRNQVRKLLEQAAKVDEFEFDRLQFKVIEKQIEVLHKERRIQQLELEREKEKKRADQLQHELSKQLY